MSVTAFVFIPPTIDVSGALGGSGGNSSTGGSGGNGGPAGAGAGPVSGTFGTAGAGGAVGSTGTLGASGAAGSQGSSSFTQRTPPPAPRIVIPVIQTLVVSTTPIPRLEPVSVNLPTPLSGTTLIPTDKTPVLQFVQADVNQQASTVLQGFVASAGDPEQRVGHAIFLGDSFNADTLGGLSQNGIIVGGGSSNNLLNLNKGSILFSSNSDLVVKVNEGTVFIPAGSVAFVYETGNDVAVYDFADGVTRPIRVQTGDRTIALRPGQQVVLTRSAQDNFNAINPIDDVGYRDIEKFEVGDGITAYLSDFAMISAMSNLESWRLLRRLDTPEAKGTLDQVMKTAAALHVVTARKDPFKTTSEQ